MVDSVSAGGRAAKGGGGPSGRIRVKRLGCLVGGPKRGANILLTRVQACAKQSPAIVP